MQAHPLRLGPGADLRPALEAAVRDLGVRAAWVVQGIGSLSDAHLRFAAQPEAICIAGPSEILSLAGSIGPDGAHVHISVADREGQVRGGHLAPGSLVRTTAEVLLILLPDFDFRRPFDPATGYPELLVAHRAP